MVYLLLGPDTHAKDIALNDIKKKQRVEGDALNYDYDVVDASKISPADLKKTLITLPVIAKSRLIVFRHLTGLAQQQKNMILDVIKENVKDLVLVFDTQDHEPSNAFLKNISANAQVIRCGVKQTQNVFDMTKAMERKLPAEALKILSRLYEQGDHPLQIMGGLVWFWGKNRQRVSPQQFQEGLATLEEADLNIKRSRFKPEYAVEMAVVKLSSLIAC